MNTNLRLGVEVSLSRHLRAPTRLVTFDPVGGGCINDAAVIVTDRDKRFFLKSNPTAPEDFFEREAEGLNEILLTQTIRVPEPLMVGGGRGADPSCPPFLILEWIETGTRGEKFSEILGGQLAALHRHASDRFGFHANNYIGSTPQRNTRNKSWVDFFAQERIGYLRSLLESSGEANNEMSRRLDRITEDLKGWIGDHRVLPSCLHGDLWGGNIMSDASGAPVLIDPAVYYGDRETDLAMTELFGRMDSRFYSAYDEAYPLEDGYDERRDLYNLYHLMNHLLLFGGSYFSAVMKILRHYS